MEFIIIRNVLWFTTVPVWVFPKIWSCQWIIVNETFCLEVRCYAVGQARLNEHFYILNVIISRYYRHVVNDGVQYQLCFDFPNIANQNPLEYEDIPTMTNVCPRFLLTSDSPFLCTLQNSIISKRRMCCNCDSYITRTGVTIRNWLI